VGRSISNIARAGLSAAALVAVTIVSGVTPAFADRVVKGERYIPGIWVDPDGCEHWVMDDGVEGYMSPHTNRQGIPVCRRSNTCGVLNTDQFFATDSYRISQAGQQRIREFFQSSSAVGFVIAGHTDWRASDEYNIKLSYNRANAVAKVARSVGANVVDVRGYGERMPVATNKTTDGMARNRRVEIICFQ
jgi:outer membrane protein OmpA-like peptidoglycan-associated protein